MFTAGLIAAATAASKWLIAGKIISAVGTGMIMIDKAINNKHERSY